MRWWMVAAAVLAVLVASTSLWANTIGIAPAHASVLAVLDVVGGGFRGTPEPVKMALLGGGLIAGSLRLRRTRDEEDTGA